MSKTFARLSRWMRDGRDPFAKARRTARLTESEALAIASEVAQEPLVLASLGERDGSLTWVFRTARRGRVFLVAVRDSDGQVMDKWGAGRR